MRFKEFKPLNEAFPSLGNLFSSSTFTVKPISGTRGLEVRDMQQALEALGFSVGPPGLDGIIGPYTRNAIQEFQKSIGMQPSGNPDNETIAALNKEISSKPELLKKLKPSSNDDIAKAKQLKPLSQDSVTQGKVGKILDFIARFESGGNYNIILGGKTIPELTSMTINQVYELQDNMKRGGKESTAVGRYQFVKGTLRDCVEGLGLDPNKAIFDKKTQDDLIIYRLRATRGLDKWLSGSLSDEQFLNNLSMEFASIPSPAKGGASYYHGVGSNRAGTNLQAALSTLSDIKAA